MNKPLIYGWNCVKEFQPPTTRLQLYTSAGICHIGFYKDFVSGFITHWSNTLPSPTKQAGALK